MIHMHSALVRYIPQKFVLETEFPKFKLMTFEGKASGR